MENDIDNNDRFISAVADDLESFYCASDNDELVRALIAYERSLTNFNDDELVNKTVKFDNGQTSS